MKTQVIHLEPHDDLISISDRMAWTKTPRLLLVWPKRGRVAVRPYDLTLLRRRAWSLGAELGLVCQDGEIRQMARELDIPCFTSTKTAQLNPWATAVRVLPPNPEKKNMRAWRASLPREPYHLNWFQRVGVFLVGVLAILWVALLFLPAAQVTIKPPLQEQVVTIPVSASLGVAQVYLSGQIPLRRQELDLVARDTIAATGQTTSAGQVALVTLRFVNLTTQAVDVPAGTILVSDTSPAVSFATTAPIRISAGNGKTAQVQARAVRAGKSGNVPANSIRIFQNSLGLKLSVNNLEPASGGSEELVASPTEQDRETLRARILDGLLAQARQKAAEGLKPGDVLFEEHIALQSVSSEDAFPLPGQPGGTLTLEIRARFVAEYVAQADLDSLAALTLDAALPPEMLALPSTLRLEQSPRQLDDAGVRWQLTARRTVQPKVDVSVAAQLIRGLSVDAARKTLESTYGQAEINLTPGWWPWLPLLPFRITVTPSM